jgi:hypothetical protein
MKKGLWVAVIMIISVSVCLADDFLTTSGQVRLRAVLPFDSDSAKEYPSLLGRLKVDTKPQKWNFHMWLEGGWDGSVEPHARRESLVKSWNAVYQSNTPYLEFKEFYGSYSSELLEIRAGLQRFSWGRLDEYPVNDLLNPWDYTQFLRKPLEDRKIGVPAVSARLAKNAWSMEAVWLPYFVGYRLPLLTERWSGTTEISEWKNRYSFIQIDQQEPDYPSRSLDNTSVGLRLQRAGAVDWGVTFFHGYDPRPVFKTKELVISLVGDNVRVDPGFVPDFHKITSLGADAAVVIGNLSLRAEGAYARGRVFNTRYELWGYPSNPGLGVYSLNPIEHTSDTIEYGIGADYRLFEDCILTMQAQQTYILDRSDSLFDRRFETIVWANLKNGFLNQKIETNLNVAYNPEHDDGMAKANLWYVLSDHWKVGVTLVGFWGPSQSLFGRYAKNDQMELDLVFSW